MEHGERNLIRTDPESEALFDRMKTIIAGEILARLQVNDRDVDDPEWLDRVSASSADRLLEVFQVRHRPVDAPRYRWE